MTIDFALDNSISMSRFLDFCNCMIFEENVLFLEKVQKLFRGKRTCHLFRRIKKSKKYQRLDEPGKGFRRVFLQLFYRLKLCQKLKVPKIFNSLYPVAFLIHFHCGWKSGC